MITRYQHYYSILTFGFSKHSKKSERVQKLQSEPLQKTWQREGTDFCSGYKHHASKLFIHVKKNASYYYLAHTNNEWRFIHYQMSRQFFLFYSSYGNIFNNNMRQLGSKYSMLIYTYIQIQLGQSIQEWTKQNLLKTSLKKFQGHALLQVDHPPPNFVKAVFHKFYLLHS